MGMALVLATVIGVAGGYAVDRYFHTDPWGFFIGLGLGIVAGFRNLYIIGRQLRGGQGGQGGQGGRKGQGGREAPGGREGRKSPRVQQAPDRREGRELPGPKAGAGSNQDAAPKPGGKSGQGRGGRES